VRRIDYRWARRSTSRLGDVIDRASTRVIVSRARRPNNIISASATRVVRRSGNESNEARSSVSDSLIATGFCRRAETGGSKLPGHASDLLARNLDRRDHPPRRLYNDPSSPALSYDEPHPAAADLALLRPVVSIG